jgi:hypothetical protein
MRCPLRNQLRVPSFRFHLGAASALPACGGSTDTGVTPGQDAASTTDASQDRYPAEGSASEGATDGPLKEATPDGAEADVAPDGHQEANISSETWG